MQYGIYIQEADRHDMTGGSSLFYKWAYVWHREQSLSEKWGNILNNSKVIYQTTYGC